MATMSDSIVDESDGNSVSNVLMSESQPSGEKCPFCSKDHANLHQLRLHINRCHKGVSLDALDATFPGVFARCSGCSKVFIGTQGLRTHQGLVSQCRAASPLLPNFAPSTQSSRSSAQNGAVIAVDRGSDGTEDVAAGILSSVEVPVPLSDTVDGLAELCSLFRRQVDWPSATWLPPLQELLIHLLRRWELIRGDELREAQHAAAFMIIPGLLRYWQDTKEAPLQLLREGIDSAAPEHFLLNRAKDLVRRGVVSRRSAAAGRQRSDRQQRAAVDKLVGLERYSAAMATVERIALEREQDRSVAQATQEEQRAILEELHPARSDLDDLGAYNAQCAGLDAPSSSDLLFFVRRLRSACTSGWSGWTNRFLRRVVLCEDHSEMLCDALCVFYKRWFDGTLGRDAAKLFAVGRAVLIPKASGQGLRPLGIGEAWYRLGMQIAAARVTSTVTVALAPIQLGTGFSAGVEICARMLQLALDSDDEERGRDVCVFSLDIKNAFNSIRRRHVLDGIRKHCPALEPLFRLFYGGSTELRFSNGAFACLCQTGVRQGDPLAMLLFALGFWEALKELHDLHQRVLSDHGGGTSGEEVGVGHLVAYADDVSGSLPAAALPEFCTQAVQILQRFDLIVVPAKCEVFGRRAVPIPSLDFVIRPDGLKRVLGCPVGDARFRAACLRECVARMLHCVPTLESIGRQSAFVLLARCVNQRAQYLVRVLEGGDIRSQFKSFDDRIDDALASILDCSTGDRDTLSTMRALPQRSGGLGIYPHSRHDGEYGRNQSRLAVKVFVQQHYRFMNHQIPLSWTDLALGYGGDSTTHTLSLTEAGEALAEARHQIFQNTLAGMQLLFPAKAAWLLSSCTPDSGRWLYYCGGSTQQFRMSDACYIDAVRRRCLFDTSPVEDFVAAHGCGCEPHLRAHSTHLLDCLGNQFWFDRRHELACRLLAETIKKVRPDALVTLEVLLQEPAAARVGPVGPAVPGGTARRRRARGTGAAGGAATETGAAGAAGDAGVQVRAGVETPAVVQVQGSGSSSSSTSAAVGPLVVREDDEDLQAGEETTEADAPAQTVLPDPPGGAVAGLVGVSRVPAPVRGRVSTLGSTRGRSPEAKVADIIVFFGSRQYTIDVSFINPSSVSQLAMGTARVQDKAAIYRENEKIAKYSPVPGMEPGGRGGFTPFVIETTGRLGPAAIKFLKAIGSDQTYHLSQFYNALSALTALYNSLILKGARRKLSRLEVASV